MSVGNRYQRGSNYYHGPNGTYPSTSPHSQNYLNSLSYNGYYSHHTHPGYPKSSIFSALQKFQKTSIVNLELNTLIIQYIAKTGDLPVLSNEELAQIPRMKFGQHINKIGGFVKASNPPNPPNYKSPCSTPKQDVKNDSDKESNSDKESKNEPVKSERTTSINSTAASTTAPSTSSGRSSKLSLVSSDSELDDSEDELTNYAWKENFMKQYGLNISEHDSRYKQAVSKITHSRKIWKVVQSVIEKKLLTVVDEYNRNYNYDKTESKRCESKNCDYISFHSFRKAIHKRYVSYFDEMPPFTLQRICELLCMPQNRLKNCGKFMRALDKNLSVTSYWKPFEFTNMFDETEDGIEVVSEDDDKIERDYDTASIHSIGKHSWAGSKSMPSPGTRSCGSQSPYNNPNTIIDTEAEMASIIRDIGPSQTDDTLNRVPSPHGFTTKANQCASNTESGILNYALSGVEPKKKIVPPKDKFLKIPEKAESSSKTPPICSKTVESKEESKESAVKNESKISKKPLNMPSLSPTGKRLLNEGCIMSPPKKQRIESKINLDTNVSIDTPPTSPKMPKGDSIDGDSKSSLANVLDSKAVITGEGKEVEEVDAKED